MLPIVNSGLQGHGTKRRTYNRQDVEGLETTSDVGNASPHKQVSAGDLRDDRVQRDGSAVQRRSLVVELRQTSVRQIVRRLQITSDQRISSTKDRIVVGHPRIAHLLGGVIRVPP